MVAYAPTIHRRGRVTRWLAPLAMLSLIGAVVGLVVVVPRTPSAHRTAAKAAHSALLHVPPYWVVRPGDTYAQIAAKTGLTLSQLEAYNPSADPLSLTVGQRLNLWRDPPRPRPKPLGPRFWTVRPGESFGSIAAKTRISITTLEQLNPQVTPATLQPGDRVQLRR